MGKSPDVVKRLVDRFSQQADTLRSPDYNETLIRIDFINPLMSALGWDINNEQNFAEHLREVVHEDRVKVAGQTKAPDYSFRAGAQRKFFLEAKKPAVDIRNNWEPAYQLRRYAWSAKLSVSLLTDFEELAIYDTRIQPKLMEKASVGRREYIRYTDYEARWDFLEGTFSKRAVWSGDFDRYAQTNKGRGAQPFDDAFLAEIEEWRKSLATSLARNNESLDEAQLNFAVQRIIDRIIFLRIAEDRGTEKLGQLQALQNGENVYARLREIFHLADVRYNSGLFHFEKEKSRDELPDTLTPGLNVDDKTLKTIIKALYYPHSPYEFTMVSADLLGSVYERFLGNVITLTGGHNARIVEKPEVRKAGGVYYTPTYIVDYIVQNTVAKLLDEANNAAGSNTAGFTPKDAPRLKILDPACGSGSFLIGAYHFLLNWYLQQYSAGAPETVRALASGKNPVLRPAIVKPAESPADGNIIPGWALTIAERKRILLDHIHGVDIDNQAVEVTKLNLLLKCLEGETRETLGFERALFRERALPDLGNNIKCGNSLIGTDIIGKAAWNAMSDQERVNVNPFDFERAFPRVFKRGGFDAIIGNPPYVDVKELGDAMKKLLSSRFFVAQKRFDLFVPFVERSLQITRNQGLVCFILPSTFLTREYGEPLRQLISEGELLAALTDFGTFQVFDAAQNYVCIPLLRKSGALDSFNVIQIGASVKRVEDVQTSLKGNEITGVKRFTAKQSSLPGASAWHISDPRESEIFAKLCRIGSPLGDLLLFASEGIHSGKDEVFFVTDGKASDLIAESPPCHPLARGRDVHRYDVLNTATLGTIVIYPYDLDTGEPLEEAYLKQNAPKTWHHLAESRRLLMGRDYFDRSGKHWYELWCQRDPRLYTLPKIVGPEIAQRGEFTLSKEPLFINNKLKSLVMRPETRERIEYVLGILNSKLVVLYHRRIAPPKGSGFFEVKTRIVSTLPVPRIDFGNPVEASRHNQLVNLVEAMLSLKRRLSAEQLPQRQEQLHREIDVTDRQIDQLVYQLYGLTDEEIAIIEEATR